MFEFIIHVFALCWTLEPSRDQYAESPAPTLSFMEAGYKHNKKVIYYIKMTNTIKNQNWGCAGLRVDSFLTRVGQDRDTNDI